MDWDVQGTSVAMADIVSLRRALLELQRQLMEARGMRSASAGA
jgi:hypothetical protein